MNKFGTQEAARSPMSWETLMYGFKGRVTKTLT